MTTHDGNHSHKHDHHNCSHGDGDQHTCDHHPSPINDNKEHVSDNKGLLSSLFLRVSGSAGKFLRSHRRKVLFGTAVASAIIETTLTKNVPVASLSLLTASAVISHDAGEDVLEDIGHLKNSQGLSAGLVGTAIGFGHTLAEGAFSLMASFNQATDMAVSSVMGSQPSHILLMAGGAAVIGILGTGKSTAWKLHAGAMGILTGAFGAQVATGEFYPAVGAAMIMGGGYYLYRRFKDGQSCAIHGSACSGHEHTHEFNRAISIQQRLTDPHLLRLGGSILTLTTAAHVMAHELVGLSQTLGISETTIGTTIAAISLAAPEIILTWKAAFKGENDLAWGTVIGCSTATVGIVGGGLALSGASVPEMLDPATTEGIIHAIAFGGSTAAILIASHPKINKSGKISKALGAVFLAAYISYIGISGRISNENTLDIKETIELHQDKMGMENLQNLPDLRPSSY